MSAEYHPLFLHIPCFEAWLVTRYASCFGQMLPGVNLLVDSPSNLLVDIDSVMY